MIIVVLLFVAVVKQACYTVSTRSTRCLHVGLLELLPSCVFALAPCRTTLASTDRNVSRNNIVAPKIVLYCQFLVLALICKFSHCIRIHPCDRISSRLLSSRQWCADTKACSAIRCVNASSMTYSWCQMFYSNIWARWCRKGFLAWLMPMTMTLWLAMTMTSDLCNLYDIIEDYDI